MKDSIMVKLNTLNFLCYCTLMPVSEELNQLAKLLDKPLDISKSSYDYIAYKGETQEFCTIFELTQKELDRINRRTFIVKIGKCVLDKIDELLSELRSEAPRGTKKQFDKLAKSILAKATTEATRKPKPDGSTIPTEQTPKDAEPTPPEETNIKKDDAGYEILPNGNVRLKEDLSSDDSDTKSSEEEEDEPIVGSVISREAVEKAIEVSSATGLPVVYLGVIDEKHVKNMIYCGCLIKIGGKRKISKKAWFINCEFDNEPTKKSKKPKKPKKAKK